jgi:serine phosphatase RsbU (regulator of sigma subunit)
VSLVVVSPESERTIVVDHTPFTIGRKNTNDLCLLDPHISREQAAITKQDEGYFIEDHGSTHGTLINGNRITREKLNPGDKIQFGGTASIYLVFAPERTTSHVREFLTQVGSLKATGNAAELERLTLCLQVARKLSSANVLDEILLTLIDATLRLTGAERGFIFLRDGNGGLRMAAAQDKNGNPITDATTVSHSIIDRALSSGSEFLIGDTSESGEFAAQQSIVAHDLRTVICIPLKEVREREGARAVEGILYVDSRFVSRDLSGISHDLLDAVAAQAAALVENAKLAEVEKEARRYEQELAISSAIQQGLMNVTIPEVPFARVKGRSIPCRDVGGDFYDVVSTDDSISVVLADVSGKGISAALLASTLQGLIYAELTSKRRLPEIAQLANRLLCQKELSGKYATLVIARLNADGKVEILNCGHVPPCLVSSKGSSRVSESNLPVGLIAEAEYASTTVELPKGTRLVLVSDGVTEAQDAEGEFFGDERFEQCIASVEQLEPLFGAIDNFRGLMPLQDDCTAVELYYRGK